MGIHNKIQYTPGQIVNNFTFVCFTGEVNKFGNKYAEFICPFCKKSFIKLMYSVQASGIKSCGCASANLNSIAHTKHDMSFSGEYNSWRSAKKRCYEANSPSYKRYGGRGITVCDRWLNSFENFLADMGKRPTPEHSLDRYPNVNGNYEPGNCRWATPIEQSRNRNNTILVEYNSEIKPLSEWAGLFDMNYMTLFGRYTKGWTGDKLFRQAPDRYKRKIA